MNRTEKRGIVRVRVETSPPLSGLPHPGHCLTGFDHFLHDFGYFVSDSDHS